MPRRKAPLIVAGFSLLAFLAAGQAGAAKPAPGTVKTDPARLARIRAAKMPRITKPVMFNTPQADAVLSALEVFPPDNPWNQLVDDWPRHPDSDAIIASIGPEKPLRYNPDMGFVIVPPDQRRVEVKIVGYPGESDKGPYPVPENMPIEGWPVYYQRHHEGPKLTLDEVQRDKLGRGGDRHGIVVDPAGRMLYEFYTARRTDAGWQAAQASIFDLKTNRRLAGGPGVDLRPEDEQAPPHRLDLLRRGRAARLSGRGSLRRAQTRQGRAHPAGNDPQDPPRVRRPGHAFCQPPHKPPLSADGRTAAS